MGEAAGTLGMYVGHCPTRYHSIIRTVILWAILIYNHIITMNQLLLQRGTGLGICTDYQDIWEQMKKNSIVGPRNF